MFGTHQASFVPMLRKFRLLWRHLSLSPVHFDSTFLQSTGSLTLLRQSMFFYYLLFVSMLASQAAHVAAFLLSVEISFLHSLNFLFFRKFEQDRHLNTVRVE